MYSKRHNYSIHLKNPMPSFWAMLENVFTPVPDWGPEMWFAYNDITVLRATEARLKTAWDAKTSIDDVRYPPLTLLFLKIIEVVDSATTFLTVWLGLVQNENQKCWWHLQDLWELSGHVVHSSNAVHNHEGTHPKLQPLVIEWEEEGEGPSHLIKTHDYQQIHPILTASGCHSYQA